LGPRRIVSLQPSATVTLRDLGRLDLLAACTRYCLEVCPELRARGVTVVSDSWTATSDQIGSVQPDFVIASVPYQEKSLAEILRSGTPVLALAPRTLPDIYADIALIARIVDAGEEGKRIIRRMREQVESVRTQTANLPRPRVFCEEWGKPLIASQAWVAELVEAAGGEFIGKPGAQISVSDVESAAPQVIIAAWCGAGDRVPLEKIVRVRGWNKLPAVVNNRVCCIRDEYLNTPAPTLVQGLHALAAAIHPDHFPQAGGLRWMNHPR